MSECVLVTGGAGFIGSHTTIELLNAGYEVVVIDNLDNSNEGIMDQVKIITGKEVNFHEVDIIDAKSLGKIFQQYDICHVIHFAGLKAVGESCQKPIEYYENNLAGTINLLVVMMEHNVNNLVFSSSCTVYGDPEYLPLNENCKVGNCTNPYGKTKYFIEQILKDLCAVCKTMNVAALRYFNPAGCHESGLIGEDPQGQPKNLMPYIAEVAVGKRPNLLIFGNDYDTHDGTCIRDYIHVVDVAIAHVTAVKKLTENCGYKIYNLGSGNGFTVLDVVKAFEKASGKLVCCKIVSRRDGDVGHLYADPALAADELQWKASKGLNEMCEDLWRWQSQNLEKLNSTG